MSISGEHTLRGRRAVVTGASRGIGAATATLLARRGATVHLVARGEDDLRRVAAEIESDSGRPATATVADVSTAEGCDRVARDVAGIGVDILVNNAGGTGILPVLQASDGEIESILSLNLLSVMRLWKS
jgi:short-subunit dehydrogenase